MNLISIKLILALFLRCAVSKQSQVTSSFDDVTDDRHAVVGLFSSAHKYKCPVNHCKFGSCVDVTSALNDRAVEVGMTFPNHIDDFNNALMCYCPYNYDGKLCENCELLLGVV